MPIIQVTTINVLSSINMNEKLVEEFMQIGCKSLRNAGIAVQVYLELCEIKRYWDVEYHYSNALERIYFTARKRKNEHSSIFIPIPVMETLSFSYLQNLCELCEDLNNQTIYIAIVTSDSTCVYYQVTNGLAKPQETFLKISKEDQTLKLDKQLKKNRKLLEEAAMYGIPITLPKKQCSDVKDANAATT